MIGDVRGKGLPAIGEAALPLGAFREAAHQHAALPQLAPALERSATRHLADFEPEDEAGERFVSALLLKIPDDEPVIRMISCGHPAPFLPAPPLGVGLTGLGDYALDVLPFDSGNTPLLYTDGVIEARDRDGTFYPFAVRAAHWSDNTPEALLHHIERDCSPTQAEASAMTSPSSPSTARPSHRRRRGCLREAGVGGEEGRGEEAGREEDRQADAARNYIREKTLEGQVIAASKGNRGGLPKVIDGDMLTFAIALKDKDAPVPEMAKKLTIKTGKNAGKSPSVASHRGPVGRRRRPAGGRRVRSLRSRPATARTAPGWPGRVPP
ncbi:PP2C family protein-serine/threonine phosphatase [Streptomyces sp. NPDC056291]|uniref:PP2C family protein-serine/threonine phosphatase n=1 Tax=Streptomyces sp. NPDC056291 TaxID=3345772 RepID=UPI0035D6C506